MKFYTTNNIDYVIGYNNLGFDAQVLEFIRHNHSFWYNHTGMQIAGEIYKFVQSLIEDQKYNIRLPFYENQLSVRQLDCFTILGLNNEARYSSLKKIEFSMDYHTVKEMPIHHSRTNLTGDEIREIEVYMKNDINATHVLFDLILGDTEHPLYRGNNQLELRANIKEEFKLDCLNYSDIKIGDELMKLSYAKGIRKLVTELPKKGTFRKVIRLKECLPEYVEFKTPLLQDLLKRIKKTTLERGEKWEQKFMIGNTTYVQSLGGLHSVNSNEIYKATEDISIITADVASMYPRSIIANGYYPAHLGKELLKVYSELYTKRVTLKPKSKTDKRIKGICDALKLQMNVAYGKMGSMDSWMYDAKTMYSVTLTGQYSLLMLIEYLELRGFSVIVGNTDGIETIVPVSREDEYYQICKEWETVTKYELEFDKYQCMYMSTVNDYLAITTDGKVKLKGDFMVDFELHKNKSNRVRALALKEYFVNGTSPIEFIKNHKNIYDFCIMGKAQTSNDNYLEMNHPDGTKEEVGKLIRYYLSSNPNAPQLFKKGTGSTGKDLNVNQQAPNELGTKKVMWFNDYEVKEDYEIDYDQYIYDTFKIIASVERNKKDQEFLNSLKPTNQLDLFK